jgi:hypothetical protein
MKLNKEGDLKLGEADSGGAESEIKSVEGKTGEIVNKINQNTKRVVAIPLGDFL